MLNIMQRMSGVATQTAAYVKLLEGTVEGLQTSHITDEDYAAGWRLSCASKVSSDVTVMVPDIASAYQSRMKTADLSTGEEVAIFTRLWISATTSWRRRSPWRSPRWRTPCPIPSG